MTDERHDSAYLRAYNGLLKGILRWPELDAVWARLQQQSSDGWYIYTIAASSTRTISTRRAS